jgi:hypothetical protein
MQWLGTNRQPGQRSPLMPPRAKKGLALRAKRAARRRETACGSGNGAGKSAKSGTKGHEKKQRPLCGRQ